MFTYPFSLILFLFLSIEFLYLILIRFQTITERCTSPSSDDKIEEDVIVSDGDTGVGAHGDRDYNIALQIPQNLDLPNFTRCALFSQKFLLKVRKFMTG